MGGNASCMFVHRREGDVCNVFWEARHDLVKGRRVHARRENMVSYDSCFFEPLDRTRALTVAGEASEKNFLQPNTIFEQSDFYNLLRFDF